MLFLGAALPATQEMVVRPRAAKAQRFRCISQRRLSGVLISIPCDCMHKGRICPHRNYALSRLFAIDYIKSSVFDISSLPSVEYLGDVRNTRLFQSQACSLRSVIVDRFSLKPLIIRCASYSIKYQHYHKRHGCGFSRFGVIRKECYLTTLALTHALTPLLSLIRQRFLLSKPSR